MELDTQALTICEVAPDGGVISLGFVDSTGKPATIRLALNQVGALAMTLPGLIGRALQTRFGDQSLRYAYPLESWLVEQSTDPTQAMVTLRTSDGVSVCFSIPRRQQSELGEALGAQPVPRVTPRANQPSYAPTRPNGESVFANVQCPTSGLAVACGRTLRRHVRFCGNGPRARCQMA